MGSEGALMSRVTRRVAAFAAFALGCTPATPARAVEVVATFAGTVISITDSNGLLPNDVVLNAPVTGRFQYETSGSSVSFPASDYAAYTFADGGMSIRVTVGSSSWEAVSPTDVVPQLELTNDAVPRRDEFRLTAGTPTSFPAALASSRASVVLKDETVPYQMVGDLDLPLTGTDLVFAASTVHQGNVQSENGPQHWQFTFNIAMVSFEPLALEPGTWSAVKRLFR
jgi:hypothetical protein